MSWNLNAQNPNGNENLVTPATTLPNSVQPMPVVGKLRASSNDGVLITLRGRVGTDPELTTTPNGHVAARFRLAVSRRGRDEAGTWHDMETTWYTIRAWNSLASNVGFSIRKGQPVVVHGRLVINQWENEEKQTNGTEVAVVATTVGHDLSAGITQFIKGVKSADNGDGTTPNRRLDRPNGAPAPETAAGAGPEQIHENGQDTKDSASSQPGKGQIPDPKDPPAF
ncbi:MAG: single-stranded DNA-binding protein [Actinomycetaceae bacterium]|nr:single-stranded DNA-binding protein [Actinomycetaceae bacterium]